MTTVENDSGTRAHVLYPSKIHHEVLERAHEVAGLAHHLQPRHGGRYEDIAEAIGHTPLVEIPRMSPNPAVRIFAKLEMANPTGSVKDRVAKYLVEDLERRQLLTPDGELNRYVNVYVNGQDVRYLEGLDTPVGERDEVRLLPAMAGG